MAAPKTPSGDHVLEMLHAHQVVLLAVATLAELRESDTESHILRVQSYVQVLARQMQRNPSLAAVITDEFIQTLCASVPMYDLGTVGVPDRILLKPGRFEPAEFEIMKTHTTLGRDAIQAAEDTLGLKVEFLSIAKEIAYGHQEKWDGSGYPEGLRGDDIPISARIMAIADVYDALISRRVYKEGMPHDKAVAIITEGRGSHFDPDMVDAFLELQDEIRGIAIRYADTDSDLEIKRKQFEQLAVPLPA